MIRPHILLLNKMDLADLSHRPMVEEILKDITKFVRDTYSSGDALRWYVNIIQEYKKQALNEKGE